MADTTNKANKRQAGKTRRKLHYADNFEQGKKNKIRKMRRTLKAQPENQSLASRLKWWVENGYTRKGTKRA